MNLYLFQMFSFLCFFWAAISQSLLTSNECSADELNLEARDIAVEDAATLRFIRLPVCEDITPIVSLDGDGKLHSTQATYLASTELSLHQAKTLLSEESWDQVQKRILSLVGNEDDARPAARTYISAVKGGLDDYPVIGLSLADMLEICQRLNELASASDGEGVPTGQSIETIQFRCPTRMEWQYAARCIQTEAELDSRLFFPVWGDLDNRSEGLVEDLQASMGLTPNASTLRTQSALVSVVQQAMQRDSAKKSAGELMGELLVQFGVTELNIAEYSDQTSWLSIDAGNANRWGFKSMLGNAREWVLMDDTPAGARETWHAISKLNDNEESKQESNEALRHEMMLMGGHYIVPSSSAWREFCVNGGFPLNETGLEPAPYAMSELMSGYSDSVQDGMGGVRLLMERTLSDNWFVYFREKYLSSDQQDSVERLCDDTQTTIGEIALRQQVEKSGKMIDAYRVLSKVDKEITTAEWLEILELTKDSKPSEDGQQSESDRRAEELKKKFAGLRNRVGGAGSSNVAPAQSTQSNKELNYFEIAASLATTNASND